jgi:hypothetical protein
MSSLKYNLTDKIAVGKKTITEPDWKATFKAFGIPLHASNVYLAFA